MLQAAETVNNTAETTTYVYGNGLLTQNNNKNGKYHFYYNNIGSTIFLTDAVSSGMFNEAELAHSEWYINELRMELGGR